MKRRVHVGTRERLARPGGLHNYVRQLATGQARLGLEPSVLEQIGTAGQCHEAPEYPRLSLKSLDVDDAVEYHFAQSARTMLPRLKGTPAASVFHFHGPWAEEGRVQGNGRLRVAAKRHIERRVYRAFDQFIVASDAFGAVLRDAYGVSAGRIATVHPGVDSERFVPGDASESRERLGLPPERPTIVCVRRLEPRMGLEHAIAALARIPDAQLVIAGGGSQRGLLEMTARGCGVADRVTFVGRVPEADLPHVYRAGDVSLVPTVALEGFGLVVLESMACGTPVVATRVGGLPEAMGPFADEWCVGASAVDELFARAVQRVLSGQGPSGDSVRDYAESRSLEAMAGEVEAIIAGVEAGG